MGNWHLGRFRISNSPEEGSFELMSGDLISFWN